MRSFAIVFAYLIIGCWTDGFSTDREIANGNENYDAGFDPEKDMFFQLYTQRDFVTPQILLPTNWTTIETSDFNASIPTRIFIHGWRGHPRFSKILADGYLNRGKHKLNFIYAYWYKGAETLNYTLARERVNEVGVFVARFINLLVQRENVELSDIHMIGHSLGAHVAGIAGKNIANGKVAKIVGLDPARPLFDYNSPNLRLHSSDAHYVETIHTNGGRNGIFEPIGQASFYPNGGQRQPGCFDPIGFCAHRRSKDFFHESLFSCSAFHGMWCTSLEALKKGLCQGGSHGAKMGGEPGNLGNVDGIFFLRTNARQPFAQKPQS